MKGDERDRAFTLFIRCYDALRRAAAYLRYYENDVDQYVPRIYLNKGKSPASEAVVPATPAVVPPPASSAPDTGTHPVVPKNSDPFEDTGS